MCKALQQVREVSVGMAIRRYPLIDLENMDISPWKFHAGKFPEHFPWGTAAADSQQELTSYCNSIIGFSCNELSRPFSYVFGIIEDLDLHYEL